MQPPTRAFSGDMTVMTRSIVQGRWMINDLVEIFTWTPMKFNPVKSWSLVNKNGKLIQIIFKIYGNPTPTVEEKTIKCLGKLFTITDNDRSMV